MLKKFPIVFICDDPYFQYTNVVISSIIANRNKNYHYEIFILSEFISPKNKKIGQKQVKDIKNFDLKFITIENFDKNQFYLNSYMNSSTYYRFYIPEIFKDYERVLYLDSDLIVDFDISELMEIPFDDHLALCCHSFYFKNIIKNGGNAEYPLHYFQETLKIQNPENYFNAGVMVLNIPKMNENQIQQKLFNSVNEIPKPKVQDQDLLNYVLHNNGGVKIIDQKYNHTQALKISKRRILLNQLKKILKIPYQPWFYIHHFTGANKPWAEKRLDQELFFHYAQNSPFSKNFKKP